jgi:tetratricopeptide (TPR) repeat protein
MTEWLLDRNPEESVAMIAATPSEWLNTPVRIALDIHDRALAACAVDSPERRLVACQRLQLIVCTGSLDLAEDAERDLEEATRVGEMLLAGRLSCALAYGYLSKGDFKRSQQFARRALTYGAATNRPGVEADFGINLSIVLDHVGQREESRALLQHYGRQVDDFGSPQQVAGKELQKVEPYLENGKIDLAQRSLDASRRLFASCDAGRMEPWVRLGDAMISVALGENAVAHRILSEIRTIDPGIGGQAVIAMADDWLAKVDCKLGEFESAAEALVRAQKFRRSLGTVPSVAERTNIRNTHQVLMERLGERELRAAYRRGARTPVPRAHAGN